MFKIVNAFCFFSLVKLFSSFSQVNSVDIDDCTTITNSLYNKKYMFCDDKEKWIDAQQFCNNYNGELLTIQNSNEDDWIYSERSKHHTSSDIWVGLKTSNYNDWTWVNNQENGYINWKPGTPNGNRKVNCARILPYSKRLNDMRCDRSYDFICQIIIPSTPTTTPTTTPTSTPTTTLTSTVTTNQRGAIGSITSNTDNNNIASTNVILILVSSVFIVVFIGVMIKKHNRHDKNIKNKIDTIVEDDRQFPFIVENELFINNKLFINTHYDTIYPNNSVLNNDSLYEDPLTYNFNSSTDDNETQYTNTVYSSQLTNYTTDYTTDYTTITSIQNMFGYLDIDE